MSLLTGSEAISTNLRTIQIFAQDVEDVHTCVCDASTFSVGEFDLAKV
jgi:hypothetical protein